jgi:chlorophyll synthase
MSRPEPSAVLELLKPITWFPPMWAFGCGVASSGASLSERWLLVVVGVVLAGPLICATSQAVNDWFDRHVDAINEPKRPIPSGRIPGRWGLYIAVIWTVLSLLVATLLGPWGFAAASLGMAFAWAYSAPPFRLKRSGWWGPGAVAISYEGIPWVTGAVVMAGGALPPGETLLVAALYSFGAHGIMTLNDFKAIEGDTQTGLKSLPVVLGVQNAARWACASMVAPQAIVIALLAHWDKPIHAAAVGVLLAVQLVLMRRFLTDPVKHATFLSAFGVTLYVSGMMTSAFGLQQFAVGQ